MPDYRLPPSIGTCPKLLDAIFEAIAGSREFTRDIDVVGTTRGIELRVDSEDPLATVAIEGDPEAALTAGVERFRGAVGRSRARLRRR